MVNFFTTPIFYITPYVVFWSILNGLIVYGLIRLIKIHISRSSQIMTAIATALTSIAWNWSIVFNQSTRYLNVDHPALRVSWADALNGICVFAMISFLLGQFTSKKCPAETVTATATLAALVTVVTDIFFF
ncbi:MAG: hypothetical protein KME35_11410 [Aphanocapsa sp. GSE-SYN-MK-11-07L]|jgi:hypothetical protein|nr:hypothetical protein [Aphanocapsa sp. GSE-SYN-MK-11-07L]